MFQSPANHLSDFILSRVSQSSNPASGTNLCAVASMEVHWPSSTWNLSCKCTAHRVPALPEQTHKDVGRCGGVGCAQLTVLKTVHTDQSMQRACSELLCCSRKETSGSPGDCLVVIQPLIVGSLFGRLERGYILIDASQGTGYACSGTAVLLEMTQFRRTW